MNSNSCVIDIECSSFEPWEKNSNIICIGVLDTKTQEIKIFYDSSEEKILLEFIRFFNKNNYNEVIGYNVKFDLRYLLSKLMKYRLPAKNLFKAKVTDIMLLLKSAGNGFSYNKPGKLDQWSKLILGKGKLYDNTEIPSLYKQNKIEEIVRYNSQDLILTFALWERINFVLYNVTYTKVTNTINNQVELSKRYHIEQ